MKPIFAVLVAAVLLAPLKAGAQEPSKPQAATPGPASEPYEPGLGEIMALQQMRHIKLWFAGRAGREHDHRELVRGDRLERGEDGLDAGGVRKLRGGRGIRRARGALGAPPWRSSTAIIIVNTS